MIETSETRGAVWQLRNVAEDIGVRAEFVTMPFDDLITALERDRIDVIISGISITPKRAMQVLFSRPYATSGITIAANKQLTTEIGSVAELDRSSVRIAVAEGTVPEALARRLFPNALIAQFESEDLAFEELSNQKAEAVLTTSSRARYAELLDPEKIHVPLDRPLLQTAEGFAVRLGDYHLLNVLNAWVEMRSRDGWLAASHSYWFDTLDWFDDVPR